MRSSSNPIAFCIALGLLPLTAIKAEAGKTVTVCNNTNNVVSVAVGWLDYGFPVATGFYAVASAKCSRISVPNADSYLPVFAYATDAEGNEYRPRAGGPSNNFCIDRSAPFIEKSTSVCTAKDGIAKQIVSDWERFEALGFPLAEVYRWQIP